MQHLQSMENGVLHKPGSKPKYATVVRSLSTSSSNAKLFFEKQVHEDKGVPLWRHYTSLSGLRRGFFYGFPTLSSQKVFLCQRALRSTFSNRSYSVRLAIPMFVSIAMGFRNQPPRQKLVVCPPWKKISFCLASEVYMCLSPTAQPASG
jgi:hypothetical protein